MSNKNLLRVQTVTRRGFLKAAAAGTLSDVFFSADLFVVPFANNGVNLDLTPYTEGDPDVDIDDVFPNMLGLGVFDGKIQMLPSALFAGQTRLMNSRMRDTVQGYLFISPVVTRAADIHNWPHTDLLLHKLH